MEGDVKRRSHPPLGIDLVVTSGVQLRSYVIVRVGTYRCFARIALASADRSGELEIGA